MKGATRLDADRAQKRRKAAARLQGSSGSRTKLAEDSPRAQEVCKNPVSLADFIT